MLLLHPSELGGIVLKDIVNFRTVGKEPKAMLQLLAGSFETDLIGKQIQDCGEMACIGLLRQSKMSGYV